MKKTKITEITKVQQIIDIIQPIPETKFCVLDYQNNIGQCCFLGHIHKHINGNAYGDGNGFGARDLTKKFLKEKYNIQANGANVNNDTGVNGYNEATPKKRIMHLLTDMLEAGY